MPCLLPKEVLGQLAPRITESPGVGPYSSTLVLLPGLDLSLPLSFTGEAPFTIRWYRDGQLLSRQDNVTATSSPLSVPAFGISDVGTYWAEVGNRSGTTQSGWVSVALRSVEPPYFLRGPAGHAFPYRWQMGANVAGDLPQTYQWSRNGIPIEGATRFSLPVDAAPGDYTVRVRNSAAEIISPVARIHDVPPPTPRIVRQPASAAVYAGERWPQGTLYFEGFFVGDYVVEHSKDGAPFSPTFFHLANSEAKAADAGEYRFRWRGTTATITTEPARLTVLPPRPALPPVIQVHPAGITFRNGLATGGGLSVQLANSTPGTTFQWRKNGTAVAGATTSSHGFPTSRDTDPFLGVYDVVVTNALGSTTSRSARVDRAATTPGAEAVSQHPASRLAFIREPASFVIKLDIGHWSLSQDAFPRVTWRRNGEIVPAGGTVLFNKLTDGFGLFLSEISAADFGTYVASVELANGLTITTHPAVLEDAEAGAAPRITLQPAAGTVGRGMFYHFQTAAFGENPLTLQWLKDGAPLSGATKASLVLEAIETTAAGSYTVRVTNRLGSVESVPASLTLLPATPPLIDRHPASVVTLGEISSATLDISAGNGERITYQWTKDGQPISNATSTSLDDMNNQDAAGRYRAIVTNISGQSATSDEALVVVQPATSLRIAISPEGPITRNAGAALTLVGVLPTRFPAWPAIDPSPETPTFPQYQWLRNGTPIPGATTRQIFVPRATVQDTGSYIVSVDFGSGPTRSPPVNVTVTGTASPAAPFVFSKPTHEPSVLTTGQPLSLAVNIISSSPVTYEWYRGSTLLPQFTGPQLSIASVLSTDTGLYTLVVRNSVGPITAFHRSVTVHPGRTAPILLEQFPPKIELLPGQTIRLFPPPMESESAPFVQWLKNGEALASALTGNAPYPLTYAANAAGTYLFSARNAYGTTRSEPIVVTLAPADPGGMYAGTGDPFFDRIYTSTPTGIVAYIRADGTATVVSAGVSSWVTDPFVLESVALNNEGRIQFQLPPAGGTISGNAPFNLSARAGALAINPATNSSVGIGGTRILSGAMLEQSGYYRGQISSVSGGDVHAIVAPDGRLAIVAKSDGRAFSAYARVSGSEPITVVQPNTNNDRITFRLEPSGTRIIGAVLISGVAPRNFDLTRFEGPLTSRLLNLASRGYVGTRDQTMIAGFTLAGTGERRLLIRGIGPSLAAFGIATALPDTALSIFKETNSIVQNDDWGAAPDPAAIATSAASAGAFALANGSRDAVVHTSLPAGTYTAQISDPGNRTGIALVELYDVSPSDTPGPKLANLSIRGFAASGENALIAGITVNGAIPRRLLIRAVGPGLDTFGVSGALRDPRLRVFRADALVADNDNWEGTAVLAATAASVGAFPLTHTSRDAALVVTLPPGSYTAQVTGSDGGSGVTLLEAYDLP